jgi:glycogen phosphorylase
VLAGDHCKEASDLGVPLVGVGFMYPQGYFHQRISNDGWQEEHYER